MSTPRWQTPTSRSRATSSVSQSDGYAAPAPRLRSSSPDARARLSRLSAADLSRRRDTDNLSIRSSSSSINLRDDAASSAAPSPAGSPTKRQRISDGPEGRGKTTQRLRQASNQPATISEDPSASLLLANGEPAQADVSHAPTLRKQRSWTELYRSIALGEVPPEGVDSVTRPPTTQSGTVEVATQTSEDFSPAVTQPDQRASWFSWSRSASASAGLSDLAMPMPTANASVGPSVAGAASSTLPIAIAPPQPVATRASLDRPAATRSSLERPADLGVSPNGSSLRTLIAGRGRRNASQTRSAKESLPKRRDEATQTEELSSQECAKLSDPDPACLSSPTLTAPPVAASSSRSSWWSRSPAMPQTAQAEIVRSDTVVVAPPQALVALPTETSATDAGSASANSATDTSRSAEPMQPQTSAGWIPWWNKSATPASAEHIDALASPPTEPERVASAPPINPIIDTLPDSRSTWSRYFGGKSVPRPAVKGEMEVMQIDFPTAPATPPLSPPLLPADKVNKPSSVKSLPVSGPAKKSEPVKDKPAAKPLTTSKKASKAALKPNAPNLVLPTFQDTFERPPRSLPPRQGAIAKALSVVNAYLASSPASHGSPRAPDFSERLPKTYGVMGKSMHLERVRRVVVIGCHGWFPAAIVQSLVGRPTGTSSRFTSMMATSIAEYLRERNMPLNENAITSIQLEGEGLISDRVAKLHASLTARLDWIDALHAADSVFVATHSQGSIVSTQLIARLIDEGHISGNRVTMLCMASVSHGPFPYIGQSWSLQPYFQYVEGEAARELFVLQDADSAPSQSYRESVQRVLAVGVRILLVASCDDQVVPLSSGLFHSLSHPGILRAVFVDSQAFAASDFIVNLVVFAVRLRNAGLGDHDLLPQLSEALAGSLTGVGHSRIYDERMVYDLAVRFAFETTSTLSLPTTSTSLAPVAAEFSTFDPRARRSNPHFLPWILRGVIEDPRVRSLFADELSELRDAFDDWQPAGKALRDVKYQLEPLKMITRRTPPQALAADDEKSKAKTAKL